MSPKKVLTLPRMNLGARTFPNSLVIHTDLKASEYADTWKAGVALAELLEFELGADNLENSAVLELGSGCGYAGLVAASLGAEVVLTDQEPLIQVLSRNVAANRDRLRAMPVVKHLDWRFAAHRNALAWGYGHFDYILCSDCMYEEDCIDPLIAVLRAMSSPRPASCTSRDPHGPGEDRGPGVVRKPTEIIFTLESRGPGSEEIHRIFFQKVKQWFKVQEITFTCSITEQLVNSDLRAFRLKRQTNASTAGQPPTASAHQSSEPKPKAFSLSCSWAADA